MCVYGIHVAMFHFFQRHSICPTGQEIFSPHHRPERAHVDLDGAKYRLSKEVFFVGLTELYAGLDVFLDIEQLLPFFSRQVPRIIMFITLQSSRKIARQLQL